ncbi:hypothetical protein G7Y89_g14214 [Cudoniella acicularis]|uniref:Uncharacterized protein n=1 Tax=Cudoniella acicularis TaxID=354080 RepID=A0A8H4VUL1_9HELO|nr:hypothetical protein G7Y89_g14214 [Cudoniella acicularis]
MIKRRTIHIRTCRSRWQARASDNFLDFHALTPFVVDADEEEEEEDEADASADAGGDRDGVLTSVGGGTAAARCVGGGGFAPLVAAAVVTPGETDDVCGDELVTGSVVMAEGVPESKVSIVIFEIEKSDDEDG